jgi:hypothetical protein
MKRYLFLVLMLVSVLMVKGQSQSLNITFDTLGPFTYITFEQPSPYLKIIPLTQNIWQIGAPHKTFFNAAYTLPNAIVTDTMNDYPVNNLSTFELIVGNFNTDDYYEGDLFIDFRHKYDSDTLHDGGYITVSWNNGQTWTNIIYDTDYNYMFTPGRPGTGFYYGNTNLYHWYSTLYNGEPGFSGHSSNWVHSCMAWYDLPVNKQVGYLPDTMRLRFNFISDGIQQNHEGWMIDQIRIFAIYFGSNVIPYMEGRTHSYFYPNPVSTTATFTLNETCHNVHYELMDSKGLVISKSNLGTCDEFVFNRNGLPAGIYFMRLFVDNRLTDVHKVVIAP